METTLCGVCRRPTQSKTGYCYRQGPCNAARQAAIRHRRDQAESQLLDQAADALERLAALSTTTERELSE